MRVSNDFKDSSSYTGEIVRKRYTFFPVDRSAIDGRFAIKFSGHSTDGSSNSSYAFLSGAFDVAGCKGVPELASMPGSFTHALRPETASTGFYTSFLKWQELPLGDRDDAPQEDFTLQTVFSATLTEVLSQTPGIFKMSPPWHLSYLDRFWLDLPQFGSLLERGVPAGSWLPYFYNDKRRTFFVLPVLVNGRRTDAGVGGGLRFYYPEVKGFFRQLESYFEGFFRQWADSLNLAALTATERQQLETFLHQQVPGETVPPFSDAEVRDRLVRFFMRYVHFYLGLLSLLLFQFRQFHFLNFYHPFVCDFAKLVHNPLEGIPGLMRRETQLKHSGFSFLNTYRPTPVVVDPSIEDPN